MTTFTLVLLDTLNMFFILYSMIIIKLLKGDFIYFKFKKKSKYFFALCTIQHKLKLKFKLENIHIIHL